MEIKEERGITIISLVVTILILLILSGIMILTLTGDNGVINKTILAKKMTEVSAEKEAIQLDMANFKIEYNLNNENKHYIGKTLYDRNLENGKKWNIIVNNRTFEQYGTGYNYIEKGTEIPNYGKTKYEWIINYDNGEIIQVKDEHIELSYKNSVEVTENLLFNIDATTVSDDMSSLGDNALLYYFDDKVYDTTQKRMDAYNEEVKYNDVTEFSGYDRQVSNDISNYIDTENNAFKFNGNNYIEIYNQDGFDFSNGFTLEFYGNFKESISATITSTHFMGILGTWNGNYNSQCCTRIGYVPDSRKKLHYSLISNARYTGSWSESDYPWNQQYYIENFLEKDNYITLVFNPLSKEKVIQKIYIDGKLLAEGWLEKGYYQEFVGASKKLNYIEFGRCTMTAVSNWCYAKGICYVTRMYNKVLNDNEVLKNVNKTKLYRKMIQESIE